MSFEKQLNINFPDGSNKKNSGGNDKILNPEIDKMKREYKDPVALNEAEIWAKEEADRIVEMRDFKEMENSAILEEIVTESLERKNNIKNDELKEELDYPDPYADIYPIARFFKRDKK